MASFEVKAGDEYMAKLERLGADLDKVAQKVIHEGAGIVADAVRKEIKALPTDRFRMLKKEEKFVGLSETQKEDLLNSLGITPIKKDREGNWNAKIGFDGYGSRPTRKYKKGLPNQLLARAVESGSTVRIKSPFIRRAVTKTKKKAMEAMEEILKEEIRKRMEG